MVVLGQFQDAFVRGKAANIAARLSEAYGSADPFPHVVIPDFLDSGYLQGALADFPKDSDRVGYTRKYELLKRSFAPWEIAEGPLQKLLNALNSAAFIEFLESLTGIKGLIGDPNYIGGGLHETRPGGLLGIHADFNIHPKLRLQRRLNFLLYLNSDWDPSFGGDLELWDREMKACQKRVQPTLGTAVVFNTDLTSYHGHPDPLRCPEGVSRRSIATYYYTAPEHGVASLPKRTTSFQGRKGTSDSKDWAVSYRHFVNDWVPFRIQGAAFRIGNTLLAKD